MNPLFLIAGAVALIAILWAKGYLGFADIFGLAVSAPKPSGLLPNKQKAADVFATAVKLAFEEAHEEVAARMADAMRSQVVETHMAAFPAPGPSAQPAPDASKPAAPTAS